MEKTYYDECMENSIRQIVEGIGVDAFVMSTNEELDSFVAENFEGFTEAKFNELLEDEALAEATNDQSTSFKASLFKKQLNEIKDLRSSMVASLKNQSLDPKKVESIKSKISQADKLIVELETSIRNNVFPTAQFAKGIALLFAASATAFGIVQLFNHAPALATSLKAKIAAAGGSAAIGAKTKVAAMTAGSNIKNKADDLYYDISSKAGDFLRDQGVSNQTSVDISGKLGDIAHNVVDKTGDIVGAVGRKAGDAAEWAANKASAVSDQFIDAANAKFSIAAYPLAKICLAGVAIAGVLFLTFKIVSKLYKAIASFKAGKSSPESLKAIASQIEDQKRKLAGAAKSVK